MTAVRTPLRPSRRSLLLSGALLGSLGLVACDPEQTEEEKPPPRATVTIEQMTTSEDLRPHDPVREKTWSVSPTGKHGMAMLVRRSRGAERELFVLTLESSAGTRMPIDTASTEVSVDGHGGVVQILAEKPVEDARHHVLWTSEDLVDWAGTDLEDGLARHIDVFGDGIAVGDVKNNELPVWSIHEDGEVVALTPVPLPDGQRWQVDDVAHTGKAIVILLNVYDGGGDWTPRIIVSEDGWARSRSTWP